ncbi:beta-N-acetylhexosaminidase [Burkholderia gladioli]|uniref:beta-N-acetylhexosaminidase n=1 Tax=Burkholderia gladioli TaxID=28095 RepID=UPI0015605562|nr:beta-N-acetylhexosaminidase [Burkholderia gladioli]MCA8169485.1 beta-N-acetylhexosaminidase [Burkholderia gladioli]NRF86729.1 beta-N-acetylhexosaminidase [Burkholderia gladioli]
MKPTPGPVMLDVVGTTLTRDDARRLAHPRTGGVILFARHFENRAQLCALTDAIRAVREDILIAVDHEGGRVQRFRTDGFTVLPAMRRLGELWDKDVLHATKLATAVGYVLAAELRACGIDLSFTPVLDLDYGRSKVIGDRAFHRDPRVVTLLAKSLNHGLALAGMANCGKHFPGHGFAEADSHVALPTDDRPLEQILKLDAAPYDWLGLSLSAVIPAHVIYTQVDARPAGFSSIWLQRVLRERLGFTGAVFSDDLSMEAARAGGTLAQAADAALEAGCDMVLVCNQPEQAEKVLDEMQAEVSAESARRIRRLRPRGKPVNWDKLMRRPEYQRASALLRETLG